MNRLIDGIREVLRENIDDKTKTNAQRFFKEQVKVYGVKTAVCIKIANQFWPEVNALQKMEIFKLCEKLFASDYCEEVYIVSSWLPKYDTGDGSLYHTKLS